MLATPPMGSKVTSGVLMPNWRATRIWPNSCSTTQAKMSTMKTTLSRAAATPCWRQALKPIHASRSRKVTWIFTAVSPKRPMVSDQRIAGSSIRLRSFFDAHQDDRAERGSLYPIWESDVIARFARRTTSSRYAFSGVSTGKRARMALTSSSDTCRKSA